LLKYSRHKFRADGVQSCETTNGKDEVVFASRPDDGRSGAHTVYFQARSSINIEKIAPL